MKWTPFVAIGCIAGLEVVAICHGINGTTFSLAIAAISGLGGYELKILRDKVKEGK